MSALPKAAISFPAGFEDICDFRRVHAELEIAEPRIQAVPYLWQWKRIRERLLANDILDLTKVNRRAFALCNPGFGGRPLAATTLFAAVSVYFPGDKAPVHRHTASASRFSLEGSGGYTTVAGEKLPMQRGDLVITPNGEWHDHGNEGTEPIFWVDMLDAPLVENMNAIMTEWNYSGGEAIGRPGEGKSVQVPKPELQGYSRRTFSGAGIVPLSGWDGRKGRRFSPKYSYPAGEVRAVQESLRDEPGSPYDGVIVEYVDPATGNPVIPTMSFRSQLLRPGEKTLPQRRTASTVFCVLEGNGRTKFDDQVFDWSRHDIFVIPGWNWYCIENASSSEDAIIYSVSDSPALEKLGLYRAQGRSAAGAVVDLSRWPEFS
ncbi:MAG: cupin domain-containing protein, partial [Vicinamibacterales bacterium]